LTSQDPVLERDFRQHRKVLWDLSYRMTGSAADADDVVQETFVRALTRPPRTDRPLLPWLVRVSLNAARDLLRRRKRRGYTGPWLPDPIEVEPAAGAPADVRYDHLESASFAFLLALEALTPRQRAVLLLRDVFDYSVRETAEALSVSEGAVKTLHHRARRGLEEYDRGRPPPGVERGEPARAALARLMTAVVAGDVASVEALLAADVELLTDGGGEFLAARRPIRGRDKVSRGFVGLSRKTPNAVAETRLVNGMPGLVVRDLAPPPRHATDFVISLDLDASGSVSRIYVVLASKKLGKFRLA
jgi:RNA polymerase sigma-70 factor, ECF subfamily